MAELAEPVAAPGPSQAAEERPPFLSKHPPGLGDLSPAASTGAGSPAASPDASPAAALPELAAEVEVPEEEGGGDADLGATTPGSLRLQSSGVGTAEFLDAREHLTPRELTDEDVAPDALLEAAAARLEADEAAAASEAAHAAPDEGPARGPSSWSPSFATPADAEAPAAAWATDTPAPPPPMEPAGREAAEEAAHPSPDEPARAGVAPGPGWSPSFAAPADAEPLAAAWVAGAPAPPPPAEPVGRWNAEEEAALEPEAAGQLLDAEPGSLADLRLVEEEEEEEDDDPGVLEAKRADLQSTLAELDLWMWQVRTSLKDRESESDGGFRLPPIRAPTPVQSLLRLGGRSSPRGRPGRAAAPPLDAGEEAAPAEEAARPPLFGALTGAPPPLESLAGAPPGPGAGPPDDAEVVEGLGGAPPLGGLPPAGLVADWHGARRGHEGAELWGGGGLELDLAEVAPGGTLRVGAVHFEIAEAAEQGDLASPRSWGAPAAPAWRADLESEADMAREGGAQPSDDELCEALRLKQAEVRMVLRHNARGPEETPGVQAAAAAGPWGGDLLPPPPPALDGGLGSPHSASLAQCPARAAGAGSAEEEELGEDGQPASPASSPCRRGAPAPRPGMGFDGEHVHEASDAEAALREGAGVPGEDDRWCSEWELSEALRLKHAEVQIAVRHAVGSCGRDCLGLSPSAHGGEVAEEMSLPPEPQCEWAPDDALAARDRELEEIIAQIHAARGRVHNQEEAQQEERERQRELEERVRKLQAALAGGGRRRSGGKPSKEERKAARLRLVAELAAAYTRYRLRAWLVDDVEPGVAAGGGALF